MYNTHNVRCARLRRASTDDAGHQVGGTDKEKRVEHQLVTKVVGIACLVEFCIVTAHHRTPVSCVLLRWYQREHDQVLHCLSVVHAVLRLLRSGGECCMVRGTPPLERGRSFEPHLSRSKERCCLSVVGACTRHDRDPEYALNAWICMSRHRDLESGWQFHESDTWVQGHQVIGHLSCAFCHPA